MRNPYRRHSTITLPKSHTWPHSEYEKNFKDIEDDNKSFEKNIKKVKDNLEYRGLTFSGKTEVEDQYNNKGVEADITLRNRPATQLKYEGLNFAQGTIARDFEVHSARSSGWQRIRPVDELQYDGLNFDGGTEAKEYRPYSDSRSQKRINKNPTNQFNFGDFSFEDQTETKERFGHKKFQESVKYNLL